MSDYLADIGFYLSLGSFACFFISMLLRIGTLERHVAELAQLVADLHAERVMTVMTNTEGDEQ